MIFHRTEVKETLVTFTPENLDKAIADLKTMTRRVKGKSKTAPYGRPGDLLLQAEPYKVDKYNPHSGLIKGVYLHDGQELRAYSDRVVKLLQARKRPFAPTSARFMPKELVRYRYLLCQVEVEPLQDITLPDILAEGIELSAVGERYAGEMAEKKFIELWDGINDQRGYGWASNPTVYAYGYSRIVEVVECGCNGRWYKAVNGVRLHVGSDACAFINHLDVVV